MSSKVQVKLSSKKNKSDGSEYWEGTVSFTDLNLAPTKLRKSDGCTHFTTKSAVSQAARNLAKKLGCEAEMLEPKTPLKKAAKKSPAKSKKAKDTSTECSGPVCSPPWLASST